MYRWVKILKHISIKERPNSDNCDSTTVNNRGTPYIADCLATIYNKISEISELVIVEVLWFMFSQEHSRTHFILLYILLKWVKY